MRNSNSPKTCIKNQLKKLVVSSPNATELAERLSPSTSDFSDFSDVSDMDEPTDYDSDTNSVSDSTLPPDNDVSDVDESTNDDNDTNSDMNSVSDNENDGEDHYAGYSRKAFLNEVNDIMRLSAIFGSKNNGVQASNVRLLSYEEYQQMRLGKN